MRINKKPIALLGVVIVVFSFLIYVYILPVATTVYTEMKAYETRVAIRDDYTLHTTPLPKEVANDLCAKLNIKETSENCRPSAIVYGPDFFDEIQIYFNGLRKQDKTHETVKNTLGAYLMRCEEPDLDGNYRCKYDLQGDGRYPVFFYFDKNGYYYRIIATIGGS
ncbi:MAG: hypothetical protein AABZ00_18995 [Chloroflexota bacterium]